MARLLACLLAFALLTAPAWANYTESWNSIPLRQDGWLTGASSGAPPMSPTPGPGNIFSFNGAAATWSPVGGQSGGCVYSYLPDLTMYNGYAALLGTTSHPINFLTSPTVSVSMLDPVLDQPASCGAIHFGVMGSDGGVFMLSTILPAPTASWTTTTFSLGSSVMSWVAINPGSLIGALQNPAGWGFITASNGGQLGSPIIQPQGVIVFDNIQVTPEPATLSLLAVGGLLLRRRKA